MLKRAQAAATAVLDRIAGPTLADAERGMIDVRATVEQREVDLQTAHDAGASESDIQRHEAALAAAKTAETRAERAYLGAVNRDKTARTAEAETLKAAAIGKRDSALAKYTKAAAEIDRLAAEMAVQIKTINDQYSAFNESRRDNVAGLFTPIDGTTLADFALKRAVAERAGVWTGDKPTAAELAGQVAGAALAVA